MTRFADRTEAGRMLAGRLERKGYPDPVVLALPRGGVPVAFEVARVLRAPLDLVMVRKIGAPMQPELAAGAVVDGDAPEIVVNEHVARHAGLDRAAIDRLARTELSEIARRRALYLGARGSVAVAGRTAIVVDDGIATGATARAALRAVRRRGPARLVLAVPVGAPDSLADLAGEADEVVCLARPFQLQAVGAHYEDFAQTGDEEVIALLDRAAAFAEGQGQG